MKLAPALNNFQITCYEESLNISWFESELLFSSVIAGCHFCLRTHMEGTLTYPQGGWVLPPFNLPITNAKENKVVSVSDHIKLLDIIRLRYVSYGLGWL